MTEEERSVLESMRQREQALMADLDAQESELRAQQQLLREQEGQHQRLMEEFEAMQEQVSLTIHLSPCCASMGQELY